MSQLVSQLRERWSTAASVREALAREGWGVSERRFSPGSTLRAVMTPLETGFAVAINANFAPTTEMLDWLLCHEVGHAVLRGPHGDPAWIARSDAASRLQEERFCNRLADRLVGRTALSKAYQHAS
jgi:hypothetical protein